jgi:hypothetical protein
MLRIAIAFVISAGWLFPTWGQRAMNNQRMDKILRQEVARMEGENGAWLLYYGERIIMVMSDERNNRMRIFTPIVEARKLDGKEMRKMLEANFHTALDAKYGLYDGFVVSLFTHPFAELRPPQLIDALRQVVNLADSFGSHYSSSELRFGEDKEEKDKRVNQSPSREKRS